MKSILRVAALALCVCLPTVAQAQEDLDRNSIYRVDPNIRRLNVVPQDEIRLGFVYKYYNPKLEKHVWGIAIEGGKFRYAMGPGSMQPADRFDLRLTELEKQRLIDESAPALSRGVQGLGRKVYAQLKENDEWDIHLSTSIPKVYDQLTQRRWEWHGTRRLGVLHTYGPYWTWEEGSYLPLTFSY